jgi:hypothetical protein
LPDEARAANKNIKNKKRRKHMTQRQLTLEEMREILCAPEATDTLDDIDFDDAEFNEEAERAFVQSWLDETSENEKN